MRRRHLASAALGVLLCAGLTGCGGESPKPGPVTQSSSPEPSPSDSPTEPVLDDAAKRQGETGARAFVRYFVDTFNYASTSGDTASLRATFTNCDGCSELVNQIRTIYSAGGYSKGGRWTIIKMRRVNGEGSGIRFRATVSIESAEILRAKDAPAIEKFDADSSAVTGFLVERQPKSWSMAGLEQES